MNVQEWKNKKRQLKLTFNDLEKLSGVPKRTLEDIFAGRTTSPRVDTMEAIEKALGLQEQPQRSQTQIFNDLQKVGLTPEAYEKMTPEERQKLLEIIKVIVSRK